MNPATCENIDELYPLRATYFDATQPTPPLVPYQGYYAQNDAYQGYPMKGNEAYYSPDYYANLGQKNDKENILHI